MEQNTFKPGDLVYRKNNVYDEGIVLKYCEEYGSQHQYYVIFCKGTDYESKPYVELLYARELTIIKNEIHKPKPPPKFKK